MIEINNLSKHYGAKKAVDDISFVVNEGEILGFLGPNGAGKSTTMNILTGYLSATSGTAKISGIDILENPTEAKRHIGYLPELPPLYLDITVREYLNFVYDLKDCSLPRKAHIDEICELVKISDHSHRLIKNLSKGYRQRVGLAQAIIGNPDVLILDEPTVGLDPQQIIEIRNLISKLGKHHTIILSSHILSEVQAVCERVVIIDHGKIVADDRLDSIANAIDEERKLTVRIAGPQDKVLSSLKSMNGIKSADFLGVFEAGTADFVIEAQPKIDVRKPMFSILSSKGWPIMQLKPMNMTLEDVFLHLIVGDHSNKE